MQQPVIRLGLLITLIGIILYGTVLLGPEPVAQAESSIVNGVYNTQAQYFFWDFKDFPDEPTPWVGREYYDTSWDITMHSRFIDGEQPALADVPELDAHHGAGCEAPPESEADHFAGLPADGTHLINLLSQTVYVCRGHVMTAIASGYALIYLTPPYMADWSNDEVVIRFRVSTGRLSDRDFIDVWISPYEEHLQLAFDDLDVDLSGPPRRALNLRVDFDADSPWILTRTENFETISYHEGWQQPTVDGILAQYGLEPSFRRRDLFEIRLTNERVTLTMPEYNGVLIDETFNTPLDWGLQHRRHH
ncbi:MAG: hypothetical protein AAF633_24135 [Chloroflexota bacterium]